MLDFKKILWKDRILIEENTIFYCEKFKKITKHLRTWTRQFGTFWSEGILILITISLITLNSQKNVIASNYVALWNNFCQFCFNKVKDVHTPYSTPNKIRLNDIFPKLYFEWKLVAEIRWLFSNRKLQKNSPLIQ